MPGAPRTARDVLIQRFEPYPDIAAALLPHIEDDGTDGAHDISHLLRVWQNVRVIQRQEGGSLHCLLAATLLHDCVTVDKGGPGRATASARAAEKARDILGALGWTADDIGVVSHAIEAHSFSANIAPASVEAAILQDADRLDAIGHVGVARCFYVSGRMGSAFYDPADPLADRRDTDGGAFAIDHFQEKLLRLSSGFQTRTGADLAQERHRRLTVFLDGFLAEIGTTP